MCSVVLLLTVLSAGQPEKIANAIVMEPVEFDGVAEDLHIIRRSGTVELSAPRSKAHLEIDVYRDGKKLNGPMNGVTIQALPQDATTEIRFAVHVIDMDYVTLGNGKADHSRLVLKIGVGSHTASTSSDFPKKDCDFSRMTSGGAFKPKASTKERVPVYWMLGGTNTLRSGATPEQVVKQNPKGDLAIIYVNVTD